MVFLLIIVGIHFQRLQLVKFLQFFVTSVLLDSLYG